MFKFLDESDPCDSESSHGGVKQGGVWAWEQAEHREGVWMSDAEQPPRSLTAGDQIQVAKSFREF